MITGMHLPPRGAPKQHPTPTAQAATRRSSCLCMFWNKEPSQREACQGQSEHRQELVLSSAAAPVLSIYQQQSQPFFLEPCQSALVARADRIYKNSVSSCLGPISCILLALVLFIHIEIDQMTSKINHLRLAFVTSHWKNTAWPSHKAVALFYFCSQGQKQETSGITASRHSCLPQPQL